MQYLGKRLQEWLLVTEDVAVDVEASVVDAEVPLVVVAAAVRVVRPVVVVVRCFVPWRGEVEVRRISPRSLTLTPLC